MSVPTTTRTVVFARAAENRADALLVARSVQRPTPPVTGMIDVISQTTVTRTRKDGSRLPGAAGEPVVTETVLATLTSNGARHLLGTIGGALIDALDTRPTDDELAVTVRSGYEEV